MKPSLYFKTHLIDKKRSHKFSWLEHLHHLPDQIIVRCLGEVGFEADVGELWLRGDVDGPVSSLQKTGGATLQKCSCHWQIDGGDCSNKETLTSAFIPFIEYPQGLNIVASITEPGIRSRIPLIYEKNISTSIQNLETLNATSLKNLLPISGGTVRADGINLHE